MSRPLRCVIVDDVRAYRLQIRSWLGDLEFDCTEFSRVKEAWKVICQGGADLIVTDIDMPQISGLQLIRAMRSTERDGLHSIPIIAISGLCDPDIDQFVRQIGASRFLPKPLDKEHFQTAVAAVMLEKPQEHRTDSPQADLLNGDFPQISPVLRRLAREAIEQPTTDLGIGPDPAHPEQGDTAKRRDGMDDATD